MLGLALAAPAFAGEPGVDPGLLESRRAANHLAIDLKRPPCRLGVSCAAVLDIYGDVNSIHHGLVGFARRRSCAHPIAQRRALAVLRARHVAFALAVVDDWGIDPGGRAAGVRAVIRYLGAASRVITAC